ncbi:hypothetical protein [Paenibacillus sp. sgz500958]|uniref:hypothetical protein n=1 Tax=Paenibacillus sp. sgz500958 TaxID=3242475 RepID=UPI0036D2BC9E
MVNESYGGNMGPANMGPAYMGPNMGPANVGPAYMAPNMGPTNVGPAHDCPVAPVVNPWATSTNAILVLFILLVIILKACIF